MIVIEKLAVVGSRNYKDYDEMRYWLDRFYTKHIISGGASGADSLAEKYAEANCCKIERFLPDWEKHGKAAGPIRNRQIVEAADFIICFWDGISKGTQSTISIAKELKKPTVIIYF